MGPEGRFAPPEAREFRAPERNNPGAVSVLEKPRESQTEYKIGHIPSPIMTEVPVGLENETPAPKEDRVGSVDEDNKHSNNKRPEKTGSYSVLEEAEEIIAQIPTNSTKPSYLPNGEIIGPAKVEVKENETVKPLKISSTARHEASHTVVGIARKVGINGVDIIPRGNALGTTYPARYDGPTAAAGHASGTGGEGHDFMLIKMHGGSPYAESAAASEILKKHSEEVDAIGAALDQHKSLSKNDANTIFYKSEDERNERENKKTQTFVVPFRKKDGSIGEHRMEAPKGTTMLDITLPKSGDVFVANKNVYSESSKDF